MPIKVLRIINRFNLGGPTFNAAYLTKYLPEEKYKTLLIGGVKTEGETDSEFILKELNLNYTLIKSMSREVSLKQDYKAYKEISKIIKEFKPDIVHTHASKAGLLGRLAAKRNSVPIIVHTFHGHVFHSYFGKIKTSLFKNIERFLATFTTKIIAISNQQFIELSKIHKIAKTNKFTIIPLGFDLSRFTNIDANKTDEFKKLYNISKDTFTISIVGRLVPIKNHKLFIDSISLLKQKKYKNIRALIVGGGELEVELKDYAIQKGLKIGVNADSDISFTSWITDTEKVYASSNVVALSSLNEGTPVSLIEAQVCACPIVTTDVGGVKDILEESSALIAKQNAEDFSDKLAEIINNYETFKTNAEKNVETVKQKFSYNRLVNDIDNLYSELWKKQYNKTVAK